jgi:hypothetical protein
MDFRFRGIKSEFLILIGELPDLSRRTKCHLAQFLNGRFADAI